MTQYEFDIRESKIKTLRKLCSSGPDDEYNKICLMVKLLHPCDHEYPDGRSALQDGMFCIVCRICSASDL